MAIDGPRGPLDGELMGRCADTVCGIESRTDHTWKRAASRRGGDATGAGGRSRISDVEAAVVHPRSSGLTSIFASTRPFESQDETKSRPLRRISIVLDLTSNPPKRETRGRSPSREADMGTRDDDLDDEAQEVRRVPMLDITP